MKKSCLILLFCLFISIPLQGAAETIKIGFLVKLPEETWFQQELAYAQQYADANGLDLIPIGVPDAEKTLAAIDSLAAQGAQGFAICPPDPTLGPAVMARAQQYNLKVLNVDDRFLDADGTFMDIPYMGLSMSGIGASVGTALYQEFIQRKWPLQETAALAVTFDELGTAKQKTDAATAALIEHSFPSERIYAAPEETTDIPGAFEAANAILLNHPEIKRWLVYSFNEEGVMGAVRALEFKEFSAEAIIGIGPGAGAGFEEFQSPVLTGYFATFLITPYPHGYTAAELLYRWIHDEARPPKETWTTGMLAKRDNYQTILSKLRLMP
ncbi:monosaccharide-transporting ATPase [Candidatus Vecturithrix granuli]|uniref:Monosaccharide-transporting ATPase n=1 Tax=Vecturithrix granuli TaxID=1499967 RepID=A0A081BXJ5_VECG1|nr:monosaccharide-transporting ATPase [Candidatus Vecturithrix granuli]